MRAALRRVASLCVVAALWSPAPAGDPPSPSGRADDVLAAVRAADDAKLRELAADSSVDPWTVADALVSRGETAAARRYAGSAPASPDVEALARFVDGRADAPATASVVDAVRRAAAAMDEKTLVAAIESAGGATAPFDRARLDFALALGHARLGSAAPAVDAYTAAADEADRIGWLRMSSSACSGALRIVLTASDFVGARGVLSRQIALERRRGRRENATRCLFNLAGVDAELGDYRAAAARYEEAVAETTALGAPARRTTISALRNLALVRQRSGEFAKALDSCSAAAALVADEHEDDLRALVLSVEGDIWSALGEYDRAEAAHAAALAAAESAGEPNRVAECRATLGTDLLHRGRLDEAVAAYEAALAPLTKPEQRPIAARILQNLAFAHSMRRDFQRACRCGEAAVALAERLGLEPVVSSALLNLAEAQRGAGDLAAAQASADRSAEIAERIGSAAISSRAWIEVAENARAAHDLDRAVDASRRAVRAVLRLTSGLAEGQSAQTRERYGKAFQVAKAAAIDKGDPGILLEFAETSRAVDFLASLERSDEILAAAVPPELRAAEQEARLAEAAAGRRSDEARAAGVLAAAKSRSAELEAARAKHEDAIGAIRRHARAAAAIYPEPVGGPEVRAKLAPDDALVIYVFADETAAALVLTTKEMRLVRLGATKDVAAACEQWDPSADEAATDAAIAAMEKALVAPLALTTATRRVLISPDGAAFRAPFSALLPGREGVHVPSASVYALLSADVALRGTKVLAVGAPDYGGRRLVALPEAEAEAKAVGDVVVTGGAATEAAVRAAIAREPRWRAVHFAVHGLVDVRRPMRSGLALAAQAFDDGVLTAQEVLQSPVPADLVVLSACDSGGGRVFTGEGLLGLPRAFLFAGSPRVIASSWKVDDAATRALMTKFYELWRGSGLRASSALAGAQAAVRADARWRHPRYWAGWTLWGGGD